MKRAFIILFVIIGTLAANFSFGQPFPGSTNPYLRTAVIKTNQPLLVIGTLETNYASLIIDSQNLQIIQIYQDSIQLASFGEKGRDGVILAQLKKKVPLLKLEEVLDYFKVPATNRTLKVMVNKVLVDPELLLADVQRIEKIEIIKQDMVAPFRYSFDKDEQYLNIVTVPD